MPSEKHNFEIEPIPEAAELARWGILVEQAFSDAAKKHAELGEGGKQSAGTNRYNETSLVADKELEQVIISKLASSKEAVQIMSEEHGSLRVGEGEAKYLAVIDGLDGSGNYTRGDRHCTLFGVFKGNDPRLSDYLAGGIIDYTQNRVFIYKKGQGAWVGDGKENKRLSVSESLTFSPDQALLANTPFAEIQRVSGGYLKFKSLGSSGIHLLEVVEGKEPAALEVAFKANLEVSAAYGLLRESGGVVVDRFGRDLGNTKYSELSDPDTAGGKVDFSEKTPRKLIISAASQQVAEEILKFISRSKGFKENPLNEKEIFEEKSRKYFYMFLRQHKDILKLPMAMHKEFGLRKNQRPGQEEDDWSNVSRHCATEMVGADVIAEKLGLPETDKKTLLQACFLHDFYKRESIETMKRSLDKTAADIESQQKAREQLTKNGIPAEVIDLLDKSLGYDSLDYVLKENPSILEQIMHYIDDITAGEGLKNLSQRMEVLRQRYPQIHEEGIKRWGKKTYDVQLEAGQRLEKSLAEKMGAKDHGQLPEIIKQEITKRINSVTL